MTPAALATVPQAALDKAQKILDQLEDVRAGEAPCIWTAVCPVVHDNPATRMRLWLNKAYTRLHAKCDDGCNEKTIRAAIELTRLDFLVDDGKMAVRSLLLGGDRNGMPGATCALYAPPVEPIEWAVDRLFPAGDLALLVGDGGSFKSTAALAIAAAKAGGYPVFGHFRCEQRPSLIISAEDAADVVGMRLHALAEGAGWDTAAVLGNTHYIAAPGEVSLSNPDWAEHIAIEAKRLDAGLIVLDPLADMFDGDENSNSELRPVMKYCRALGAQTKAAVLIVHHFGKAGEGKRPVDRIRGASRLFGAARSVLAFDYHDTGVTVEHLKSNRAPKLNKFVLGRRIEVDRNNAAQWISASLTYHDARQLTLSRAESFVMTQVRSSPGITSTKLREASHTTPGVNNQDVSDALNTLHSRGVLNFEGGPNNTRKWYVAAA